MNDESATHAELAQQLAFATVPGDRLAEVRTGLIVGAGDRAAAAATGRCSWATARDK
ncbi:MAG: hypothetical protein HIU57_07525 [Acidobacteria bacterium]|nr:hypothetical protein [Acidobacteriota bacterium]